MTTNRATIDTPIIRGHPGSIPGLNCTRFSLQNSGMTEWASPGAHRTPAHTHTPLQQRDVSLQASHVLLEELHDVADLGSGVVAKALAPHELLESPDLTKVEVHSI